MSAAQDPMIGRIIDGRYRVLSLVAVGGMGRVYKAEQFGLGRTVAIKVLAVNANHQAQDPHFRERFAFEAATASRLTSPNTITIFHYGRTDDDIYYIVMEYVEGITLGRLLKQEGRLSVVRAIAIAGQVCLSLREAHARGIVHRDIKPSNIMLIDGDYDQVKILDFGIARQTIRDADIDQELTSSRAYIGTPEYMAPEYFDGQVDSRSDIYSLGVVLYLLVTGRLPFKGKTATQTILLAMHGPSPAIDPALGVPQTLQELILACLERDPDHRPYSIDEVLHALQLALTETENNAYGTQAPMATDVGFETVGEEQLTATHAFLLGLAAPEAPARARPRRLRALVVAGALSIGVAGALAIRSWQRADDPAPAVRAAPAARQVSPSAARPAPAVAPLPVPAPPAEAASAAAKVVEKSAAEAALETPTNETAKNETAKIETPKNETPKNETPKNETPTAAPEPEPAPAVEKAQPGRRTRRTERARHERSAAPKTKPADVTVPDGYKPSPY
jgi:eukaryotic-like serine/threonine-protein kinase